MVKGKTRLKRNSEGLIKAVSIIDYIFAVLFFVASFIIFLMTQLLLSPQAIFTKSITLGVMIPWVLGEFLFIFVILFGILGVLFFYLGKGISNKKHRAKVLQIIVAIIVHLFSFPIGTAIAVFELYVLLINKDTKNIFKR